MIAASSRRARAACSAEQEAETRAWVRPLAQRAKLDGRGGAGEEERAVAALLPGAGRGTDAFDGGAGSVFSAVSSFSSFFRSSFSSSFASSFPSRKPSPPESKQPTTCAGSTAASAFRSTLKGSSTSAPPTISLPSLREQVALEEDDDDDDDDDGGASSDAPAAAAAAAAAEAEAAASLAASLLISAPVAPSRRSTHRNGSVTLAAARTACSWRSWRFWKWSFEEEEEVRRKGKEEVRGVAEAATTTAAAAAIRFTGTPSPPSFFSSICNTHRTFLPDSSGAW